MVNQNFMKDDVLYEALSLDISFDNKGNKDYKNDRGGYHRICGPAATWDNTIQWWKDGSRFGMITIDGENIEFGIFYQNAYAKIGESEFIEFLIGIGFKYVNEIVGSRPYLRSILKNQNSI